MDEPRWLDPDYVDEDDESCPICGDADRDCDCEERADFIGDNSLFHPDETEEEYWDHED